MYTVILNEMNVVKDLIVIFSLADFADGADFFNQMKIQSSLILLKI